MIPPEVQAEIAKADPAKQAKIAAMLEREVGAPRRMSDRARACPTCGGITYLLSMATLQRYCRNCQTGFQP